MFDIEFYRLLLFTQRERVILVRNTPTDRSRVKLRTIHNDIGRIVLDHRIFVAGAGTQEEVCKLRWHRSSPSEVHVLAELAWEIGSTARLTSSFHTACSTGSQHSSQNRARYHAARYHTACLIQLIHTASCTQLPPNSSRSHSSILHSLLSQLGISQLASHRSLHASRSIQLASQRSRYSDRSQTAF